MPLVLLRDKASGMLAYFANSHNPADTAATTTRPSGVPRPTGCRSRCRTRSGPRHPALRHRRHERAGAVLLPVARSAPLKAARPNTYIKDGTCYANRPRAVDWILGARKVSFSNYDEDRSHLVDITTDHPVISSTVTVDPARLPRAWATTPPPPVVPKVTY